MPPKLQPTYKPTALPAALRPKGQPAEPKQVPERFALFRENDEGVYTPSEQVAAFIVGLAGAPYARKQAEAFADARNAEAMAKVPHPGTRRLVVVPLFVKS